VYILRLDRDKGRIGLSLRRLQPDPWSLVETKYVIGQRVEGTITNIVDFGAFAHLEESIEGLVHVSELSDEPINHPRDVVSNGERHLLEIIKIEADRKRIGLSLKRVPPDEQAAWREQQGPSVAEIERAAEEFPSAEGEDESAEPAPPEPERKLPAADEAATSADEVDSEETSIQATAADVGEPQLETIAEEPVA